MPFLHVLTDHDLPHAAKERLSRKLTDKMASIMRKDPTLTAVFIDTRPDARAYVHAQRQNAGAHLEITITRDTNTPDEKARMLAESAALLRDLIPGLPLATYGVIREIDADSWGYDGMTQQARKAATLKE